MPNTRDIVEQYFHAWYSGDLAAARRCLADDLTFTGPAASFSNADQYLRANEHVVRGVRSVARRVVVVDGHDACMFYDLHLDGPIGVVPIAEWYHLEDDKISSIRTILDTAPFTTGPALTTDTAIDPVCGMRVARASAAATRVVAEHTYFFCNSGCAEVFDAQPERYVTAS